MYNFLVNRKCGRYGKISDRGLLFSRNDKAVEVNKRLIYYMAFLNNIPYRGGSRIFLKRGLTPPGGSRGMPRTFFISNALKRYFLHFGGSLTTKYHDQNSDYYT